MPTPSNPTAPLNFLEEMAKHQMYTHYGKPPKGPNWVLFLILLILIIIVLQIFYYVPQLT